MLCNESTFSNDQSSTLCSLLIVFQVDTVGDIRWDRSVSRQGRHENAVTESERAELDRLEERCDCGRGSHCGEDWGTNGDIFSLLSLYHDFGSRHCSSRITVWLCDEYCRSCPCILNSVIVRHKSASHRASALCRRSN